MSASISTLRASSGTSNSAALAAMPEVRQPANAASILSPWLAAASTTPTPAGPSIVTKNRRVGGVAAFPSTSCAPISTRALTPRCQVERSLTVRFPRAGFSRTLRSISFMPSTSTSFNPSAIWCPPWVTNVTGWSLVSSPALSLEQPGDQPGGAVGAVERHRGGVYRLAEVLEHRRAQSLGAGVLEVEPDPGAEAIEASGDVQLLLEVVAQREVEEGRAESGQLHRGGEPALDDREVGGRVMREEVGYVVAHLDAGAPRRLHLGEARTAHQDQPRLRDLGRDQGEGLRALAEEAAPDPRPADGGQDHALVGPVAELGAQGRPLGEGAGIEVEGVARETEVLAGPLPHVGEVGAELAVQHVFFVADQDRQVPHVGMPAQVVDVLRVLLPAADELGGGAVFPHREQADEVGEEGVGGSLEIRVLVEEVVEVPALVADPQIVAVALDHVGQGHEVRGHDLVHVPERVERVQLVIGGPALEVRGLVLEQARGRVHPLPPVPDHAVGGIAGEEVDHHVGVLLAQPPGDREIARD